MAKLLIVGTQRYSINACDFDLMFRHTEHEIVKVLYHHTTGKKRWFSVASMAHCPGNRCGIYTKLKDHPCEPWHRLGELVNKIEKLNFDYICLGNGNCEEGKWIQKNIQAKYLFSEYGWMPWNECFFIDDKGTGPLSSVRYMSQAEMKIDKDRSGEINALKQKFKSSGGISFKHFVYVPLQVDTPMSDGKPDFKFQFTGFKNNKQFLSAIEKVVPDDITILVKNHPASRHPTPVPSSMVDISKANLNKYELYQKMLAMIAINSTSVLEAILFERNVFTYGQDVFSGKGITHESISNKDRFASLLKKDPPEQAAKKFINTLLQRQVSRIRCRDKDMNYIKSHYWTKALSGGHL